MRNGSLIGFLVKPSQAGKERRQSPQMLFMKANLLDNICGSGQHKHVQSLHCFEDRINGWGICFAVIVVAVGFTKTSRSRRHKRMRLISAFQSKSLFRCHIWESRSGRCCSHDGTQSRCWNKLSWQRRDKKTLLCSRICVKLPAKGIEFPPLAASGLSVAVHTFSIYTQPKHTHSQPWQGLRQHLLRPFMLKYVWGDPLLPIIRGQTDFNMSSEVVSFKESFFVFSRLQ